MKIVNDLKDLVNQINLTNINIELIKSNSIKLSNIYSKLILLWKNIKIDKIKFKIFEKTEIEYKKIKFLLDECFLSTNIQIKNKLSNCSNICVLKYHNIELYWLNDCQNIDNHLINKKLALKMLKITICLNEYRFLNKDTIKRIIIWIPINIKRNFHHDIINTHNLKKAEEKYEAFVASGCTFGDNPRISIITRYEEIEKLLIHELIHNFYIDGSDYHDDFAEIINEYKIIKKQNNYDYEYSIYESYTELLSTYFYLLFKNLLNKVSELEINEKLLAQIIVELLYSYNLICNLSKLNGYKTFKEFNDNLCFIGKICTYEYYFIKGLMYNHYQLKIGFNKQDFIDIYKKIIIMIKQINNNKEILLNQIYDNQKNQQNFKYQIN